MKIYHLSKELLADSNRRIHWHNMYDQVAAYVCDHGNAEDEHEDRHPEGELDPVRPQHLRPVVNQAFTESRLSKHPV